MRADLHVHTNYSYDGLSTPEEVVDSAISNGLNYIAITDHGTTEGAERALEYARGKNIVVLVGQEVECTEGRVLAINIKKELPDGVSIHDIVRRIHKQGGFAIAPHPYLLNGIGFNTFISDFDAIEGVNGNDFLRLNSQAKWEAKRYGMPMIAASGAHHKNEVGRSGIEFNGDLFDCLVSSQFKLFGDVSPMHRVLFWQIKYRLDIFLNKHKKLKRVIYGGKEKSQKRAVRRRPAREESFEEA